MKHPCQSRHLPDAACREYQRIPRNLRERAQWAGFRVEGHKKTPLVADTPSRKASSTNRTTWRPFGVAVEGLKRGAYNALAYALDADFVGVDLDDCFRDGTLSPHAAETVRRCQSYAERSFSGDGVHILLAGSLPGGRGLNRGGVEVYGTGRFFITTGNHLPDTPSHIVANPDAVNWLLESVVAAGDQAHIASEISNFSEPSDNSELSELSDTQRSERVCQVVGQTMTVEDVLRATLPRRAGERNIRILDLARGLKFNAGLHARPFGELRIIVQRWHRAALPVITTKVFTDSWTDFVYAWQHARVPLGAVLADAWERATTAPPAAAAAAYDSEPVRKLVAFCAVLGGLSPTGDFFLSSHVAGRFLNAYQPQVLRWLRMLEADGLIVLVHHGDTHRANRYRWITPKAESRP